MFNKAIEGVDLSDTPESRLVVTVMKPFCDGSVAQAIITIYNPDGSQKVLMANRYQTNTENYRLAQMVCSF